MAYPSSSAFAIFLDFLLNNCAIYQITLPLYFLTILKSKPTQTGRCQMAALEVVRRDKP